MFREDEEIKMMFGLEVFMLSQDTCTVVRGLTFLVEKQGRSVFVLAGILLSCSLLLHDFSCVLCVFVLGVFHFQPLAPGRG